MKALVTVCLLCCIGLSSCKKDETKDDYVPSQEILELLTKTSWKLVRHQWRDKKEDAHKDYVLANCQKDDVYTFKKANTKYGGVFELHDGPLKCYANDPPIMVTKWEYTRENELTFNNFGHIVLTLNATHFVLTIDADQHDVFTYVRTN